MKKHNVFLALMVVLSMCLSACGASNPFEGKWVGTFDMTDLVLDVVLAEDGSEEYAEYLDLKNLILKVDYTFEDGTVKIAVDEDSVSELIANLETSMYNMMDIMIRDQVIQMYQEISSDVETLDDVAALTNGMYETGQEILDDLAAGQGYSDYETFIKDMVASINTGEMMRNACSSLNLYGDYEYDEEAGILTIYYEDNTYEELAYEFSGEQLMIYVEADGFHMEFVCDKVSE